MATNPSERGEAMRSSDRHTRTDKGEPGRSALRRGSRQIEQEVLDEAYEYVGRSHEAEGEQRAERRPAYVKALDLERRMAQAELAALDQGLTDLAVYLTSPKFAGDRSVNVEDVLLRVREARSAGHDAAAAVPEWNAFVPRVGPAGKVAAGRPGEGSR
jgi:hypothetical protein